MANKNIRIEMHASPAEVRAATAYTEQVDPGLTMTSFEEIPGEVNRLVAEAFIAGARSREKDVGDRQALASRIVEALHDGGFGTIGYDMVSAKDVAEDVLDALGYSR